MAHTQVTKTYSENTGAANTFSYSGSFDTFIATEVVVLLDDVALTYQSGTIDESASPRQYTVDSTLKTIHIGGANLSSGTIIIKPVTNVDSARATYSAGSSITSNDLNNNQTQVLRKLLEIVTANDELDGLRNYSAETSLTSSTTKLPTSSAVNSWVINLLTALGGFFAISNEVSFPNANPDPEDDAGTVVSIADAGGVVVNSSGVSTTGRTAGGSTVTITGFPSAMQSKTLPAGMGLIVQTTSTLNTYTYHKAVGTDSDIITISDQVSSFNQRYRFGSTDPTSDNDQGDLFFNTSTNLFKVYDDGAWIKTVPSDSDLSNIAIVAGELGWSDDLGSITESLTTASGGDINTVADNIAAVKRYADEYTIASSAPGSPSEGDLWYDSTNNVLKFYNGSAFIESFTTASILDEDNMASNSATQVPSQQSVNAYVDNLLWLDDSARTDGSIIYYNNSAGTFKADATTTSTIVDGGSYT